MRRIVIAAACAGLALAGCGGSKGDSSSSSPASSGGTGSAVDVSAPADGAKKFDQASLTAKAGKLTIKFDNKATIPHGVSIEGNGVDAASDVVTGSSTSFSVDLKPGKYTYYCPVGDHRAAGMEGTLTVS
jgi:plastocyanin